MKTYIPYIAGLALVAVFVSAIIFVPKACNREVSPAQLAKAEANAAEWQAKSKAAETGLALAERVFNEKIFLARDTVRILRELTLHLRASIGRIPAPEVITETVHDTLVDSVRYEDLRVYSGVVSIPRTGVLNDSVPIAWIDRVSIRAGVAGIDAQIPDAEIRVSIYENIITEHPSVWYWVGGIGAVLVAYILGGAL